MSDPAIDAPVDPDRPLGPHVWALWLLIVLIAGIFRFLPSLGECPPGLFRDEAEKGYNAWALATTGGVVEFSAAPPAPGAPEDAPARAVLSYRRWPLVIDVMGVKTSAIYQYAAAPFVRVLGLTPAATRTPAAVAGTLTVALLGIVLLRVWPPSFALAAALWLALSPWHVVFSRWALQGIFVPLFLAVVLAGLAALHRPRRTAAGEPDPLADGLRDRPPFLALPLACAGLGLAFYAYSGAQPFIVAFAAGLVFFYRGSIAARPLSFLLGLALFLLFAAPRIWSVATAGGGARLASIAVWGADPGQPDPSALQTFFSFVRNYLAHFNPMFLFFRGDTLARHGIPGVGQLLPVDVVFLPLGLWTAFRRRLPLRRTLLLLFVTAPFSAAITRVGIPHALRSLPMVLPAAVWGGLGVATAALYVHQALERRLKETSSSAVFPQLRRPIFLTSLFLLAAVASGIQAWRAYQNACADSPEMQAAFAASERAAFEETCRTRSQALSIPDLSFLMAGASNAPPPAGAPPDSPAAAPDLAAAEPPRIFVDGAILYGPYFAMFFCQLPPQEVAEQGLEAFGFYFLPPGLLPQIRPRLRPGDMLIGYDPSTGLATATLIEPRPSPSPPPVPEEQGG